MKPNETMDGAQAAVIAVWDWLPAFRAVAETEHLPTAARRLHLTVSAVSRTVRLLEDHLGAELFDRIGRNLRLNAHGHSLLDATRAAMRRVDEAIGDVTDQRFRGPLRLSAPAYLAVSRLMPALTTVLAAHPHLRPEILFVPPFELTRALLSGRVDLALATELAPSEDVRAVVLGKDPQAVYCGRGHPLWGRDDVCVDDLARHPFCGPPPDPAGVVRDGWPVDVARQVTMHFSQMAVGVGVCEAGGLLAVLPVALASPMPTLWRVPVEVVPTKSLFAVLRQPAGATGPADLVLAALTAA